jgi:aryl-alcohol dehydrogenase-like predicted oxidoreductase
MLPIPGTSRAAHLEENVAAAGLKIDASQLKEIGRAAGAD